MIQGFKLFEKMKTIRKEDLVQKLDAAELPIQFNELDDIIMGIIGYDEMIVKYTFIESVFHDEDRERASLKPKKTRIHIKTEEFPAHDGTRPRNIGLRQQDIYSLWRNVIECYILYSVKFRLATSKNEYLEDFKTLHQRCEDMGIKASTGYYNDPTEPHINFKIPIDKKYLLPEIEDHKDLPENIISDFETFCQKNLITSDDQRNELMGIIKKLAQ